MSEKAAPMRAISALADRMEEPLETAIGLARGLDLLAHELNTPDNRDSGRPILALAALLADRLALVEQTWRAIKDASEEQRGSGR